MIERIKLWLKMCDRVNKPLAVSIKNAAYRQELKAIEGLKVAVCTNIKDITSSRQGGQWINILTNCEDWKANHYKLLSDIMKSGRNTPVICEFVDINQIPKAQRGMFIPSEAWAAVEYKREVWPPITELGKMKCRARNITFNGSEDISGEV